MLPTAWMETHTRKNLEALVDTVAGEHGPERVAIELQATALTTDVRLPRVGFRWVLEECHYGTMKHKNQLANQALGYKLWQSGNREMWCLPPKFEGDAENLKNTFV